MIKFDEFDVAKVISLSWDKVNTDNNRRFNAANDVLAGAHLWGVDVVSVIGALSAIGRADIAAEVMDEFNKRGIDFNANMEL